MIGFFGVTAVVIGFALVLWEINYHRGFVWLFRRQLWTVALAVYLYALTPVDTIVVHYNVQRILNGDPAPAVEISVHPISSEGILLLQPLLDCDNEIIRDGVAAMLAERESESEMLRLRAANHRWGEFATDQVKRREALDRFHQYAYQWY